MHKTVVFINDFIKRKGGYIFAASIFSRLLSFLASWIALQLIPSNEFGYAIYAFYIITFLIPLAGFGLSQGLLRYGSQLETTLEKNSLFIFALKKGSYITIFLITIIILLSGFLTHNLKESRPYFIIFSFSIFSFYLLGLLKIQFRVIMKNKLYAKIEIAYNIIFVVLIYFLSLYYKATGYALSFVLAPLITFLLFFKYANIHFSKKIPLNFINFKFYKFGFFSSLGTITAQLLFAIDIILIGNILNDSSLVTAYKYVMLVPFSLQLLTSSVMITDFVTLTKQIHHKKTIKNYIKNYLLLFSGISVFILLFFYAFGKHILSFFKEEYQQYHTAFILLTGAVIAIILLRGLFDNLLSALGKSTIIYLISTIGLFLNYILNSILIPKYSITGAAFTTFVVLTFTGILSAIVFYYYFKRENDF